MVNCAVIHSVGPGELSEGRQSHSKDVRPRTRLSPGLGSLLQLQAGAISRGQALALGLTPRVIDRLLEQRSWRPLARGIYVVGSESWLTTAWAGVLLGGHHAVLGRATAAHLWGLVEPPPLITVYVGTASRARSRFPWTFVRGLRRGRGEPPRTFIDDTLLDHAAEVDPDAAARLIAEALSRRLTSAKRLRAALDGRGRTPHRALLQDILGDVGAGAFSALEVRYLRDVERAHGLPRPLRQARLGGRALDCLYAEWGVVVELDGAAYHRGARHVDDLRRDTDHAVMGLTTLRFDWAAVALDPCAVARTVAEVLGSRGWAGDWRTCRRCSDIDARKVGS